MDWVRDPCPNAFQTRVVGVGFPSDDGEQRQDILARLAEKRGADVSLFTEPHNPHDSNAIAVWMDGKQIGYRNRELAARLKPNIDTGRGIFVLGAHIVEADVAEDVWPDQEYEVDLELGTRA